MRGWTGSDDAGTPLTLIQIRKPPCWLMVTIFLRPLHNMTIKATTRIALLALSRQSPLSPFHWKGPMGNRFYCLIFLFTFRHTPGPGQVALGFSMLVLLSQAVHFRSVVVIQSCALSNSFDHGRMVGSPPRQS